MSWTDRGGRLLAGLALLGCMAGGPAGYDFPGEASVGAAVRGNIAVHTGRGIGPERLARLEASFRESAPDTVRFDFDSARVDPSERATLERQAGWLRRNPMALVRIEGHADLVGGERYNERLGLQRARAVATRLAAFGVDPARLQAVESFGETRPVVPVEGREPRNRRAVLALVGWGRPPPGFGFDGKRAVLAYTRYQEDRVEEVQIEEAAGDGG